ncbi:hypothetical protein JCM10207_008152 [Rhodosporidiobolus poonsookiae]
MASLDLKLSLADETRLLSVPATQAPSWTDLAQQIQQRFALDQPPHALTYLDDDADEITLSSNDELAELFAASAGETVLQLTVIVNDATADAAPVERSAEITALLASVRTALEKDCTLASDLRSIVHDTLGAPPRFRHFHHPHEHFGSFRGGRGGMRGGRGGLGRGFGGRHRHHHHRFEDESTSSSSESDDEDAQSVTDKQASPEDEQAKEGSSRRHHKHKGRKGFKHHGRRGFPGPPPPPFGPAGFPFAGFEAFPPPPPPHHAPFHHNHPGKHGKHRHEHPFHPRGHHMPPPPPPPFFAFPGAEDEAPFPPHPAFFEGFGRRRHGHGRHHRF